MTLDKLDLTAALGRREAPSIRRSRFGDADENAKKGKDEAKALRRISLRVEIFM
jgi:hypothetical protein